jgi:hypothetical protein
VITRTKVQTLTLLAALLKKRGMISLLALLVDFSLLALLVGAAQEARYAQFTCFTGRPVKQVRDYRYSSKNTDAAAAAAAAAAAGLRESLSSGASTDVC